MRRAELLQNKGCDIKLSELQSFCQFDVVLGGGLISCRRCYLCIVDQVGGQAFIVEGNFVEICSYIVCRCCRWCCYLMRSSCCARLLWLRYSSYSCSLL